MFAHLGGSAPPRKLAEMFRTSGGVTLLWPNGALERDTENADFRNGPVSC